ncbi:hypothetical protein CES85_0199 [Ochrobactrum quorumnocens]|uniref:Uncharacterized protein n=1 Tax=Ochrobactrum quorumnocens TaxID=271865 RepID=A0A248UEW0_9HYPH|nr:hypothetical protein CES85_0199 [[Ochrobactrum] quorumnocens]
MKPLTALSFYFDALSDAKPLRTFAGNALMGRIYPIKRTSKTTKKVIAKN